MLLNEIKLRSIPFSFIDISPNPKEWRDSEFTLQRFVELVRSFRPYIASMFGERGTVYILIGQSTVSFLRDFFFIWTARLFRHRIVAHLKGGNYGTFYRGQPRVLRAVIKRTFQQTDSIVVLSDRLIAEFDFVTGSKTTIDVVPNGLPIDDPPEGLHAALAPGEPIRLLYLSNMIGSKGYWDVLEACRMLAERGIPFACSFDGEFVQAHDDSHKFASGTAAKAAFNQRIRDLFPQENVRWHGRVDGETKFDHLRAAHCFVLPTRYYNEGQPVSMIEALAYGKVLISTQFRAIPDMLRDGENGFFVTSGRPEQIADRVEWLWRNPSEVSRLGAASHDIFRQHFTRERHVDSLLRLLLHD